MTQAKTARADLASVLASVTPLRKTVRVCFDGALLAEIDALNAEYFQARIDDERLTRVAEAPKIAKRIEALRAKASDAEVEFVFQSIGRLPWRDLAAKHKPTPADKEARADVNLATFPIAAMAACCVEPVGATEELFSQLAAKINQGQWDKLWSACHGANVEGGDIPLSVAGFETARATS